ncbi:MAG TPA: hypothetical protein VMG08_16790 [Allosphingosinicella sp.]|nr:hypothetical protein [Allosphingosinicella sp.]
MTNPQRHGAGESAPPAPAFAPVKLRYRHDGLTPARQVAVVQAMAACGCIREACAKVGISTEAVYELRRRPDAHSFRAAMDVALNGAADRVEDAVFSRAIEGVEVPHYYKGELVGTHRRYDERLALFLLRYRKPHRYGKHLDRCEDPPHPERAALAMADMLTWVASDAFRDEEGAPRQVSTALLEEQDEEPWSRTNLFRWGPANATPAEATLRDLAALDARGVGKAPCAPHMPSTTSTSAPKCNRRLRRKAAAEARKR